MALRHAEFPWSCHCATNSSRRRDAAEKFQRDAVAHRGRSTRRRYPQITENQTSPTTLGTFIIDEVGDGTIRHP